MVLPDIKQLKELLELLRSQGVLQYNSTDLQLVLSEHLPISSPINTHKSDFAELDGEPIEALPTVADIEAYINGTTPVGVPKLDD